MAALSSSLLMAAAFNVRGSGQQRQVLDDSDAPLGIRALKLVKNLLTIVVCSYIVYIADVYGVMARSRLILRGVLYASYACYALFGAIWFFLTFVVGGDWERTHMQYIYVATAAVSVGGVLWTIALWPVFHIWTIPLGIAILFAFLSLLTLIPGKKSKSE